LSLRSHLVFYRIASLIFGNEYKKKTIPNSKSYPLLSTIQRTHLNSNFKSDWFKENKKSPSKKCSGFLKNVCGSFML